MGESALWHGQAKLWEAIIRHDWEHFVAMAWLVWLTWRVATRTEPKP
jgi:hypothetical protein